MIIPGEKINRCSECHSTNVVIRLNERYQPLECLDCGHRKLTVKPDIGDTTNDVVYHADSSPYRDF